jgi:hypothetical protein
MHTRCMHDYSADLSPPAAAPELVRRPCVRHRLKLAANMSLGIATGAVVWWVFLLDGFAPTVAFGGFVLYLILMEQRVRM